MQHPHSGPQSLIFLSIFSVSPYQSLCTCIAFSLPGSIPPLLAYPAPFSLFSIHSSRTALLTSQLCSMCPQGVPLTFTPDFRTALHDCCQLTASLPWDLWLPPNLHICTVNNHLYLRSPPFHQTIKRRLGLTESLVPRIPSCTQEVLSECVMDWHTFPVQC